MEVMVDKGIVEKIALHAKQKIVDLQSDLAERLHRYEYDSIMPKIQDLEAANTALQVAAFPVKKQVEQLTLQQFLAEILVVSTTEEQQTITVVNQLVPKKITGDLTSLTFLCQAISKIFARAFDPDTVVRSFEFSDNTAVLKFLMPKHQHSRAMVEEFEHLLELPADAILDQPLARLAGYVCQFYQIATWIDTLEASITVGEKSYWFEVKVCVPNIVAKNYISNDNHKLFIYIDGDNAENDIDMIRSVSDFEVVALTSLDDLDYRIALNQDLPIIVLLESNDTLIDFIKIYQRNGLKSLPNNMQVSYIGSNYLQTPLPEGLRMIADRLITPLDQIYLHSILVPRNLSIMPESITRRLRILSLEDYSPSRAILDCLLGKNCQLVHFDDPVQALVHLQHDSDFDLLLIDIGLPNMTGIEFVQLLPVEAKGVPKIAVTAHNQNSLLLKRHGFDHLLKKPYSSQQLLHVIQHYCLIKAL